MATGIPMKALVQAQIDLMFQLHAESVVEGDYYRSGNVLLKSGIHLLAFPLRPAECDGVILKAGDQKVLLRINELGIYAFQPASGDYIGTELEDGNVVFHVLSGVEDSAWVYWMLFCRRDLNEGA